MDRPKPIFLPHKVVAELTAVGKSYRLFNKPSDRLKQHLFGGSKRYYTEVKALEGLSLELYAGEVFAIVGLNGSGKSTLLKILAGTLKPTTGSAECRGRVAALLELGAGFNFELTGRENARINAALLGLNAATTDEYMPDIERFADVGTFFDHPVKTYSSGMFARVAFATMIAARPDVLIVDEILAVGDEPFQRKCFARIDAMAQAGTTIVFVTHNSSLVTQIAHRALLLERGRCTMVGTPRNVVHYYYRTLSLRNPLADETVVEPARPDARTAARADPNLFDTALMSVSSTEYACSGAVISAAELIDDAGRRVNQLHRGREYEFRYRIKLTQDVDLLECGSLIKNTVGVELGGILASTAPDDMPLRSGDEWLARIHFCCRLLPGTYFFNAGVRGGVGKELRYLHRILDALAFRVVPEADLQITGMVDFSAGSTGCVERSHVVGPNE